VKGHLLHLHLQVYVNLGTPCWHQYLQQASNTRVRRLVRSALMFFLHIWSWITGISDKAMAIRNSFINDIFECIATEALSELLSHHILWLISSDIIFRANIELTSRILEEIHHLIARDPNICSHYILPGRTRQACHLWGYQVCDEYVSSSSVHNNILTACYFASAAAK
jgi:hypothetical protein